MDVVLSLRARAIRFGGIAEGSSCGWLVVIAAIMFFVIAVPQLCGSAGWERPWKTTLSGGTSQPFPEAIGSGYAARYAATREFIVDNLRLGSLPLWMPHSGFGAPLALEAEFQIFNPLEWMYWFNDYTWWTIVRCLQGTFAAFGIFLLARYRIGLRPWPSLCGALVYGLTGYSAWFWLYPSFYAALVPLPYILYYLDAIICKDARRGEFVGAVVSMSLLLLGGQPQITFCATLAVVILIVPRLARSSDDIRDLLRKLGLLGLCGCCAILIAAPHVGPLFIDEFRGDMLSGHEIQPFLHGILRPPDQSRATALLNLFNIVSPFLTGFLTTEWFANPIIGRTPVEDFALNFGYVGTALLALGIWSAFLAKRINGVCNKIKGVGLVQDCALVFVFVFTLIFLQATDIANLWPFSFVNFSRYCVPMLSMLGAIIIAFACAIAAEILKTVPGRLVFTFAGIACVAMPIGEYFLIMSHSATRYISPETNLIYPALLTGIPAVSFLIFMIKGLFDNSEDLPISITLFLGVELAFSIRYGLTLRADLMRWVVYTPVVVTACLLSGAMARWYSTSRGALVGAASLSIWVAGWAFFGPKLIDVKGWGAAAKGVYAFVGRDALSQHRPRYLAATSLQGLGPDWNAAAEADSVAVNLAIGPVYLDAWIWQFLRPEALKVSSAWLGQNCLLGLSDDSSDQWNAPFPSACQIHYAEYFRNRDLFNAFAVTHLVANGESLDEFVLHTHVVPDAARGIVEVGPTNCSDFGSPPSQCPRIYQDERALPRAYFSSAYRIVPYSLDAWVAREEIAKDPALLRTLPIVEIKDSDLPKIRLMTIPPKSIIEETQPLAASIERYRPNQVTLRVDAPKAGLVVLNDLFHPFWIASINGIPTQVVRVNSLMRGVFVERGPQTIEFRIDRFWLPFYLTSAIGIAMTISMAALSGQRKSRPSLLDVQS
jgi:hypothetical protein